MMDKNLIKRLPVEIYDLTSLETLQAPDNRIPFVSPCLGQLINLIRLDLHSNCIDVIP